MKLEYLTFFVLLKSESKYINALQFCLLQAFLYIDTNVNEIERENKIE